ncbi:hypothetical protein MNBD_GAMMA08-1766 [hydrothermal vent metagenome]|uniref:Uncharacterized protein n=1 Tax=hydrothermal vent metagenome TaxID=652676 RepID=A0A3B0XX79_9ZZZZ
MAAADDLAKLARLRMVLSNCALKDVLAEIAPLANQVVSWIPVNTSGSAVCRYNAANGSRQYEVRYQVGDLGNLVHELTHVSVNESYDLDFINYPNTMAQNVPDRIYDGLGRCTNEGLRQTKQMNHAMNAQVGAMLKNINSWAVAANELSASQKKQITTKLLYGMMNPQKECDTVLNQILVWMYEWGYPMRGHMVRKPVVNALYEELEKAAAKLYKQRAAGRVHRAMVEGAHARRRAMGYSA